MLIGILIGAGVVFGLTLILFPDAWLKLLRSAQKKIRGVAVEDKRLPHERFPRVLNWRKGDEFQTRDRYQWPRFYAGEAKLIKLTAEGRVFLQDHEKLWNLSVEDVCEHCWNLDASNREITEEMKQSSGYTEALEAFNQSVRELQRRDEGQGIVLSVDDYPQIPTDIYS